MSEPAVCRQCGRARTAKDRDYDVIKTITQGLVGWYTEPDGDFCPEDMVALMQIGNHFAYTPDIEA